MVETDAALMEALHELAKEEGALAEVDENLGLVLSRYRVAARRYAAVRDVIEEMLGGDSPYATNSHINPIPGGPDGDYPWPDSPNFGRYRYMFKSVGDAVYQAIRGCDDTLTLAQLVGELKKGGMGAVDARAVNASLLNMKGVEKTEDGKYQLAVGPDIVVIGDPVIS